MPVRSTKGLELVGSINIGGSSKSLAKYIHVSATISPGASAISTQAVEERSYTTGLGDLGANDILLNLYPLTAPTSGVFISHFRVSGASSLVVGWGNVSTAGSNPGPTTYIIEAVRFV